jgi:Heparinase II/III-like protein
MITRRKFLQAGAVSALSLPLLSLIDSPAAAAGTHTGSHSLLFDAADVPRIKRTLAHPRFSPLWKTFSEADLQADKKFLTEDLRLNNHVLHLNNARMILERTSFAYAVAGDPLQLEVAKLAITKLLEYKKWDYFQEGGKQTIGLQRASEMSVAMSFACDWLKDSIEPAMLAEIERQIGEKGAPSCYLTLYGLKYPDRVRGWGIDPESDYTFRFDLSRWPLILNSTNLKVIPIAGLGIAACHLRGRHPLAEQWLDMALQSAKSFAPMFHTDGSYDEGVGYWGYTALYLTLFLEVLYRKTGIDERSLINYPGGVRYALQMTMPTDHEPADAVNFSDAHGIGDISVAAWAAKKLRDPIAQYVALNVSEPKHYSGLVWFDAAVKPKQPGNDLLDVRFGTGIIVSRSGWDKDSSVLAFRSGPPANHEHADRNSIIFAAHGQRLLHDPFNAAYSHTQPRWLLRTTEAHTALLIDGKGHQYHDGKEGTNASWAFARILAYNASPGRVTLSSDATDAYQLVIPDVKKVFRSVLFLKPDVFLVLDTVEMSAGKAAVQARFQVFNDDKNGKVRTEGNEFYIDRPGVSLNGRVFSSHDCVVRAGTLALAEDLGIYPYAELESSSATAHDILTVCTAQKGEPLHGRISARREGTVWRETQCEGD